MRRFGRDGSDSPLGCHSLPSVQAPFPYVYTKTAEAPIGSSAVWCAKRDLNPYGKTTRPSNVRVCQFRHSRKNSSIITKTVQFVKPFFKKSPFLFLPRPQPGAFGCRSSRLRGGTRRAPLAFACPMKIFSIFGNFFRKNLLTFRYHNDIILMSKR